MQETSLESIQSLYDTVRQTFRSGKARPIAWRKHQLKQLGFLIQDNEAAFCEALAKDLSRPSFETTVNELNHMKAEINEFYDHVEQWAKPKKVKTSAAWALAGATLHSEPKGTALIIGTWNFPIVLLLSPFAGAIAAGCTAILKPNEQAANVAALIAQLVPKYMDNSAYKVVLGAVEQTTKLLELKFDHIFYTGSGNVGKIIATAAAKHLTPVTLELGGKSPAFVFDDANIDVTGRRLMWGKYTNAGQICIAPDYVLTTKQTAPKLIESFKKSLADFNPPSKGSSAAVNLVDTSSYCKIISKNHFNRLSKVLDETSGEIVIGGKKNEQANKIEITVVNNVKPEDSLMQDEIFGPILPIVVFDTADEMIDYVNDHDNPLALYVFSQNSKNAKYVFERTRSGGFVQNDTVVQFVIPGLPFGGAGASGYGEYHGKASFDTFSHKRAAASVPTWMDLLLASRYPPYNAKKLKQLLFATGAVIKKPSGFGPKSKLMSLLALIGAVLAMRKGSSAKL